MENETLNDQGGWNSVNQFQNYIIFTISMVAIIFHLIIWFQLFIHKTKFDLTILFPLGYISTDIFLLSFYFIQYSIRIRSWIPITPLFCYFEAYSMFYFNLVEIFCLAALNICRYYQVVRNQNIYKLHRRKVITSFVVVSLLLIMNLIVQDIFGWCIVIEQVGSSCALTYTNIIVRIWNMIVVLITPIFISFYMLFRAIYYLQNSNTEQVFIRRNRHRPVILHSLIFYSMWLTLWSPLIIIIYLDVNVISQSIQFAASIANTLETSADPFITIFLDKRFAEAWKKSYHWVNHRFNYYKNIRVHPTIEMTITRQINTH